MAPTPAEVSAAESRLVAHAGLSKNDAHALVTAVLEAAQDQTIDMITGAGPLPTSMTASRAHQLHFICRRAKRMLSQRETEVVFRATSTQARSIIVTMYATYEEILRVHFRNQMIADAQVSKAGREDENLAWSVRFTEQSSFDFALDELKRLGLMRWATPGRLSVVFPRAVPSPDGDRDALAELGLQKPK